MIYGVLQLADVASQVSRWVCSVHLDPGCTSSYTMGLQLPLFGRGAATVIPEMS